MLHYFLMRKQEPRQAEVLIQALLLDTEGGERRTVSTVIRTSQRDTVRMLRRSLGEAGGDTHHHPEVMLWFAEAGADRAPEGEPHILLGPDERILLLFRTSPEHPLDEQAATRLMSISAQFEQIMAVTRATMGEQIGQEIGFDHASAILAVSGDRQAFLEQYGFPLDEDLKVVPGSRAEQRERRTQAMTQLVSALSESAQPDGQSLSYWQQFYSTVQSWIDWILRRKKA